MDNQSLQKIYNDAYRDGKKYAGEKNSFFTFTTDEITCYILKSVNFKGKRVLEIGCGTGETAYAISQSQAKSVLAVDYSKEAIKSCNMRFKLDNLKFQVDSYENIKGNFDIILLQEVIEHLDDPENAILFLIQHLDHGGKLVVTCPNFTNIRGYVWMTLQILFNVPMSLSDLHFFTPADIKEIAIKNRLNLEWTTFLHDRVCGDKLIIDMRKRLSNALRDAKMDNSKVDELMKWLEKVTQIDNKPNKINGAKGLYIFSTKE